ncbi:hypothetical protein PG999_001399 [Apiospora kogelbergensis]|uniref:LYR motif-containing protein 2 n=1 Tax=Apiospora kogelbergensis TaxID=1337665 RepID=A0AAW0REB5_9PEZI
MRCPTAISRVASSSSVVGGCRSPLSPCGGIPPTLRSYATEAPRSKRLGATLSLEHVLRKSSHQQFLQRTKVLALYRTILRGTAPIKDATTKAETRSFARAEFERHRGVTDLGHIRYLLSTGKTEWEAMERYIGGM